MTIRRQQQLILTAVFALLAAVGSSFGQSSSGTAPSLAELQMRLKHAKSETELDPKQKQDVIATYEAAIERLEIATEATVLAVKFQQRLDSAAADLRLAREHLAELPEQPAFSVSPDTEIDALERTLSELRKQVDEPDTGLRAKADALKNELASRKSRLEEIARDLAEIDERVEAIQQSSEAAPEESEPRELTMARQVLLQVRLLRANEERTALRTEQSWCESDDATELLKLQRDIATRQLTLIEAEIRLLQAAADQRRGSEADQRVHAAEQAVATVPASLRPFAEHNLALAIECRDVATALRDTNQRVDSTRASFNSLKSEFDQSRTMVDAVGLTESIGLLLRQQRSRLSDTRGLRSRLALRGESVRQARMRGFQIEAEMTSLQDLDAAAHKSALSLLAEDVAAQPLSGTSPSDTSEIDRHADQIKPLLEKQSELLERLSGDYDTQFKKLVMLDNDERKLLEASQQYLDYIDERVLWIRTGTVFGGTQATRAATASNWLTDGGNWHKVIDAFRTNLEREPLPYAIAITALLAWIALRWTVRRRLQLLGSIASEQSCREILPTLQAVALTLLIGSVTASLLAFLSWRLDHSISTSRFVHAVAVGLLRAAQFAVPLELLRVMVMRGGLAEQHFAWSASTLIRLRRHVAWFLPTGLVLIAIVGMIEAASDEQRLDSLGRLVFLAFAGLLALFCYRAFPRTVQQLAEGTSPNPAEPTDDRRPGESKPTDEDLWWNRLARLGAFLAVAIPLGLVVLCWSGYFYTALQIAWRLQSSAWLAIGITLLRGCVLRWIALERRRMAILQAEELQAIEGAGKQPEADGHSPFLFPRWTWPDFRLNLTQIVQQVRSLLDTGLLTIAAVGLWFVWADVTPALNILDRVTLWQTTVEEVVASKGADDKPVVQIVQRPAAITAANLGLAILLMSIAVIAGRNVPGLVEVILLEHLAVDAGIRFATTCLVRYTIFTTGIIVAFHQVGIGWNSVQWLVAAASVGLGFGLQEIFANFVSGIILLFERPMRVGDVITIGSTTGTVSRIRFRATTIVDGDRKELIVPNKSFITGNLLNWTLSDSINRVAIKVGVAYGSDPNKVRELLLKIAADHPSLLKDPAPTASLEELGDSALIFQLRAFLPNLKNRQAATHELNQMIHDRFRTEGIDIPFPQQEVSINFRNGSPSGPHTDIHGSLEQALQRAGVNI